MASNKELLDLLSGLHHTLLSLQTLKPKEEALLNAIETYLSALIKAKKEEQKPETDDEEDGDHSCEEDDCETCRRGIYCDCMDSRCPHCSGR